MIRKTCAVSLASRHVTWAEDVGQGGQPHTELKGVIPRHRDWFVGMSA